MRNGCTKYLAHVGKISRTILIACRIQTPDIASALIYRAVNDIPVAALIVARRAVSENPVIARSCDRVVVSVLASEVSVATSTDEKEHILSGYIMDRCWIVGNADADHCVHLWVVKPLEKLVTPPRLQHAATTIAVMIRCILNIANKASADDYPIRLPLYACICCILQTFLPVPVVLAQSPIQSDVFDARGVIIRHHNRYSMVSYYCSRGRSRSETWRKFKQKSYAFLELSVLYQVVVSVLAKCHLP